MAKRGTGMAQVVNSVAKRGTGMAQAVTSVAKRGTGMAQVAKAGVLAIGICMVAAASWAADDAGSQKATAEMIRNTMISKSSPVRQETYRSVTFDNCVMNYTVSGTYPVGDPYTVSFTGLDFSSLNIAESRPGSDYTPFVLLNFARGFRYRTGTTEIPVHSTVINVSDDEGAARLHAAFVHLAELCGAKRN